MAGLGRVGGILEDVWTSTQQQITVLSQVRLCSPALQQPAPMRAAHDWHPLLARRGAARPRWLSSAARGRWVTRRRRCG
jgi:hypothetical protein